MSLVLHPLSSQCFCYAFSDREMAVRRDGSLLTFDDLLLIKETCQCEEFVEELESGVCALSIVHKELLPSAYQLVAVRTHFYESDDDEIIRTSRAKALVGWIRNTHYCGHCGAPMQPHDTLSAMTCTECGLLQFPRIEPCIIVLVHRDDKILLARHVQRNTNIYACIAGFIEAGETVENAVAREVYEETHLRIRNIRYFGSQSWPFPSQLMLGFTAEYDSGEIRVQADEIERAAWFDPHDCPASPPPGSIAYELIEDAKLKLIN